MYGIGKSVYLIFCVMSAGSSVSRLIVRTALLFSTFNSHNWKGSLSRQYRY
jgi:hypothetical protein